MAKQTCAFIYVAAASIIQSIVVVIVDFPVSIWLSLYDTWVEFSQDHYKYGIISQALYSYYRLGTDEVLLAFTVSHLIVHLAWIVSSCVLLCFLIKSDPRKHSLVLQFAIVTLVVCLCDLGATGYTAIYMPIQIVGSILLPNYDIGAMCFFPLFFSKAVLFLIHNFIVGIIMVGTSKKIRAQFHSQQTATLFGRDNPVVFHQGPALVQQQHHQHQQQPQKNDLVDNFYNYPAGPAVIATSHAQVPEPITYKSPMYRPPYLEELQRHSIQSPPKFTVPLPNPDY